MDPEIDFSKGVTEVVPLGGAHPSGGARAAEYAQRVFRSAQDEALAQTEQKSETSKTVVTDLDEFRRLKENQ
ncbi:hypothetical protein H0W80_03635 [Candidatus Saccharibacteria bacterium]|nr:hypothetical protein [Candidatus Saccharibacteria bacterium]